MLAIFLDTETNGLNPGRCDILEIAFKVLDVRTGELKLAYESVVKVPRERFEQSDQKSLEVNGFSWELVEQGKQKESVSEEIIAIFEQLGIERGKAIFICQNPSFDRAFFSQLIDPDKQEALNWPYHWLDLASMYWAENVQKGMEQSGPFPWETGVSKDKISTVYHLSPEKKPHRAMNGVNHLIACYEAVVGFPTPTKL
ncbi:MAG: DNA polymerase III PolC-type [Chlamydiae bacterium]|nr:DNA polymerase III PolC-type [Chlamydiota bacterium]